MKGLSLYIKNDERKNSLLGVVLWKIEDSKRLEVE
jgi:hypothetical protein